MKATLNFAALLLCSALLTACATPRAPVAACTSYCSTQDEGYQWAQSANLLDARGCEGYGPAFTDGCRQAVSDGALSANPQRTY